MYLITLLAVLLGCLISAQCDTGGITPQGNLYEICPEKLQLCKVHFSRSELSYKTFFQITESNRHASENLLFDFHFAVMAPSDAHILIAPSNQISSVDPVYEIVLGAGANSFSDIRRLQKKNVKKSIRTKSLLNSTEARAFWLHISKDGLIEVGRANEELAFLSWQDPSPLPVEVFSFSTWAGIEAKWYFDCPRNNNTDVPDDTEIKRPLTDMERLKRDMFLKYDPYVRPVLDAQDLTIIDLRFVYDKVQLDENKSKMSVQGTMHLDWRDDKIFWNASDYGNITEFHAYFREIWLPSFVVFNAVSGAGTDFLRSTLIEVNNEGGVTWKAFVNNLEVWCDPSGVKNQNWPADEHLCEVQLGFTTGQANCMLQVLLESNIQESEWKVESSTNELQQRLFPYIPEGEDEEDSFYSTYVLSFQLRRKSNIYVALYYAPIFAIYVSMLLTFFMPAEEPYRISLNCLQIILLSILFINISIKMPHYYGSGMPSIVCLYVHGIYAAVFSLVISVIIINLTRIKQKRELPNFLCTVVSSFYFRKFVKFEFTASPESYNNLTPDNVSTCSLDKQEAWNMFAKMIDRIFFTIYFFFFIFHMIIYL